MRSEDPQWVPEGLSLEVRGLKDNCRSSQRRLDGRVGDSICKHQWTASTGRGLLAREFYADRPTSGRSKRAKRMVADGLRSISYTGAVRVSRVLLRTAAQGTKTRALLSERRVFCDRKPLVRYGAHFSLERG